MTGDKSAVSKGRGTVRAPAARPSERSNGPGARAPEAVARVRELAWTGLHAKAIVLASERLAAPKLKPAERIDLLDLRAESYVASGELDLAAKDSSDMVKLANKEGKPSLKAQALSRKAVVQMRRGELKPAVRSAAAAAKLAAKGPTTAILANALYVLSEAEWRTQRNEAGIASAQKAAALFRHLGDDSGEGRSLWSLANAYSNVQLLDDSRRAAEAAFEACQRAGDQLGSGNALIALSLADADIAERIRHTQQAGQAFEISGYVDRQSVAYGNLALIYSILGLYGRARRITSEVIGISRARGAKISLTYNLGNLVDIELALGALDAARLHLKEFEALVPELGDPVQEMAVSLSRGNLAFAEGNFGAAARDYRSAIRASEAAKMGREHVALTELGETLLADRDPAAALRATTRATKIHRAQGLALPDGFSSQEIWWRHAQALNANRKTREAREALDRAYDFLIESIRNIRDIGLRRNALNKVAANRELIRFWVQDGTKRRLPKERLFAHLNIESSLREPFRRLADTGLRLNALRTVAEIQTFLVEEATELTGGERVMLILESDGKPKVAESILPRGEDATRVLRSAGKHLGEARRTRAAQLTPGTKARPSRIVAPLIAQNQIVGYLYADMEILYGTFDDTDRDLLGMLANQGAVALDNAGLLQGLEQKVEHRTAQLRASNADLEQRNAELQIINSIQQGLAAELDFQAIVDLVGDKLREVFDTPDMGINWYDEKANLIHPLYAYEHGKKLTLAPYPPATGGLFETMRQKRAPVVLGTAADYGRFGGSAIPGTDQSKSLVSVPIISSDRVFGTVQIENYERENAFGESELRLLTTIAASLGTALENARLFDETQRLFKAEQERVAELQIINSIQQGLAAELDFQAIVELVGDKLREVFGVPDLSIIWYDEKADLLRHLYMVEHGKRLSHEARRPTPGGVFETHRKTRQPVVFNSLADYERYGAVPLPGTDQGKSYASVPIISSDRVLGAIALENFKRESAYGEPELRLLTTIAASLGTALENARLFDEVQRLFKAEQERVAELQIINSIQQGLAAELDFQAIVDLVGDKLREVFRTPDLVISWHDQKADLIRYLYVYEHGKRLAPAAQPPFPGGRFETISKTRQPIVWNTQADYVGGVVPGTDQSKSLVSVPIISSDRVLGLISIENFERENAFGESELRLLTTVSASLGTALENARLFDEVQKKNAEVTESLERETASNSVLQVIAESPTDIQPVVEAIARNAATLSGSEDAVIAIQDGEVLRVVAHYGDIPMIPVGEGIHFDRYSVAGRAIIDGHPRQAIHNQRGAKSEYPEGDKVARMYGYRTSSSVPLMREGRAVGVITIRRTKPELLTDNQVSLVQAFANQAAIAVANVQLFEETQRLLKETEQRAAELAIINSVQAGIASKLDAQQIYDLVGDKLRQVFRDVDVTVAVYDPQTDVAAAVYLVEHGERLHPAPFKVDGKGFTGAMVRQPRTILVNERMEEAISEYGSSAVDGTSLPKSFVNVPLLVGGVLRGILELQDMNREHAFSDADVRLLETIANSVSVALENARLFDETQRLLKITEDRAAELAIINSVQAALAAELNLQGIYDAVGDKIREIFKNQDVVIRIYDPRTNLIHFPYLYENGEPITLGPIPLPENGFGPYVMRTRQTLVINENMAQEMEKYGSYIMPGTAMDRALVYVPLVVGDQARGLIGLTDTQHEHAFSESEVRLLETLANAMSVALENARLFDETQRLLKVTEDRAAELAVINSIQQGLAAELNFQNIVDLVGEKLREVLKTDDIGIRWYDPQTNLVHYLYQYEHGERMTYDPQPPTPGGTFEEMLRNRQSIRINDEADRVRWNVREMPGSDPSKSSVNVPIIGSARVVGSIIVENYEREYAFSDADLRLLSTVAASMGVALENARLFDETERLLKVTEDRAAELAVINSIQQGLAAELNFQNIVDLVGDKLREVLKTDDIGIRWYDPQTNLVHYLYEYEHGERLTFEPRAPLPGGTFEEMLRTRQPIQINDEADRARFNVGVIPGTDVSKSAVNVPIIGSARVVGSIVVENYEREYAFSDADVRLLTTVSASMGVALENARLFDETQQRNAELAIINSVQASLAAKLDLQAIYDAVGDKIREIFDAQSIIIGIYDRQQRMRHFPYMWEKGQRLAVGDAPFNKLVDFLIASRQPLVINESAMDEAVKYGMTITPGSEAMKSGIFVPLITGKEVMGVISLQNVDRENAFSESDVRLLQTLANSMSVALESARLFDETQQRNAELAIINSVQASLAAKLDMQAIYDAVGEKIREIFDAQVVSIVTYDPGSKLMHYPYTIEKGMREVTEPQLLDGKGVMDHVIAERRPIMINTDIVARTREITGGEVILLQGEATKSRLDVPMIVGGQARGGISLQNVDHENAFTEADLRLLQTLANSMSVALENARLFDETERLLKETEQRNAELAIINGVQAALAAELNIQGIYDAVGDRIRGIFHNMDVAIAIYDPKTNLLHYPYIIENGKRLGVDSIPLPDEGKGMSAYVIRSRKTLVINEHMAREVEKYGSYTLPGTQMEKSHVRVPLVTGDQARGYISLSDMTRENAFSESDVRLLQTLANSMSVALENARLFDETQRLLKITEDRAAELAIINSVQAGLASKLDMQAIYDLVGEKLGEVLRSQDIDIRLFDVENDTVRYPFMKDKGTRMNVDPSPFRGISRYVYDSGQTLVVNEDLAGFMARVGSSLVPGTQMEKSFVGVPIKRGTSIIGMIGLSDHEKEHAFGEADVRLLETVVSSMSVALENARLFDETERLLKITEDRAAELAIINSVQAALAAELNIQGIYDAVGDKIREIFHQADVGIRIYDPKTNLVHYPYVYENGERITIDSRPLSQQGFAWHVLQTRETLVINDHMAEAERKYGSFTLPGTAESKSELFVPLVVGDQARGLINLSDYQREHAFSESDVRLLQTLANAMSIALENARLFDETQRLLKETEQRNAELAIINSVQDGLVAKMDIQGIYDLVGDKIRDIFDAQSALIIDFDLQNRMLFVKYGWEKGKRFTDESPLNALAAHIIESRQTVLINDHAKERTAEFGMHTNPGTEAPKSLVFVPLVVGSTVRGMISLQNVDRENAISESDVRLLTTLANSMSVALENARLFDESQRLLKETEQRNAELAIINSVQASLVAELNMQGIYDAVGDKIREIFHDADVGIRIYEPKTNMLHFPYAFEGGERIALDSIPLGEEGFAHHVIRTRETIVINENITEEAAKYGSYILPGTEAPKSQVMVPLVVGDQGRGLIEIVDMQHEHAFSDSDVRLLQTLTNSMSVALENARLFDETQRLLKETEQRNAELAIITSVQQGLASKLEMQGIYDLVGDKIREIFDAQVVGIVINDKADGLAHFPYAIEKGERFHIEPRPPAGISGYIFRTGKPVMINENLHRKEKEILGRSTEAIVGEDIKSRLDVPMMVGREVRGVISLQNVDRENAFTEADLRLLTTLANSMSVALENARLFDETERLLKETEQRNAELAIINKVQEGLASKLEMQAIYDLVGDEVRSLFDAQAVLIVTYDRENNQFQYPYNIEKGERFFVDPTPPMGFSAHMIETRQPILIRSNFTDHFREITGRETVQFSGEFPKSWLGVPLLVGNEVRGTISLQNVDREEAYDEADLRLLSTLAGTMSVALENARLFDETQRLFRSEQQRAAELAVISSIQEGIAAELDFRTIVDLVGDKLRQVFKTKELGIRWFNAETGQIDYLYEYEHGERILVPSAEPPPTSTWFKLVATRQPVVFNTSAEYADIPNVPGTDQGKSMVNVPILGSDRVLGSILLEDYEKEYAFGASDVRLLTTVASSMGVALENARLFAETQRLLQETEQRAAELGIINSVQEGLASKLDVQGIVELVGAKICAVFGTQDMYIGLCDRKAKLIHYPYGITAGVRDTYEPIELGKGLSSHVIRKRAALVINTDMERTSAELGAVMDRERYREIKSWVGVPIVVGKEAIGLISLQDVTRENAFAESQVNLLTTLANSMSVALENARLFDETTNLLEVTEQRAGELAIINGISQVLTQELDLESLIDLVGDRLRAALHSENLGIGLYEKKTGLLSPVYVYRDGQRVYPEPASMNAFSLRLARQGKSLVLNDVTADAWEKFGSNLTYGSEIPRSVVMTPILAGGELIGGVTVQDFAAQNAFGESLVSLLETIASNMGTAIQNARLFEETNRLLTETEQHAAELAIINSVQQGLASKLDMQAIYDLVGNKICEIFSLQTCFIMVYDKEKEIEHYPFMVESGERVIQPDLPHDEQGFGPLVMRTRQPVMINEDMEGRSDEVGSYNIVTTSHPVQSAIYVPLLIGDEARGVISVQNTQREHAYTESDLRLVTTLASSTSVALESARLFAETEQRAAELAIINSVQQALASKLEEKAIYELTGEKLRELFSQQAVSLVTFDLEKNISQYQYLVEKGQRVEVPDSPISDMGQLIVRSRETLLVNTNIVERLGSLGIEMHILPGTETPQSILRVPILIGGNVFGFIGLSNLDRENAFSDSDVRLLTTLASSLSVALESARLFSETEQRAAELQIINSVQEGLASKLEVRAIYELVGDKLRQLFDTQAISLVSFDMEKNSTRYHYVFERGQRLDTPDAPTSEMARYVIATREPLRVNERAAESLEALGIASRLVPGTEPPRSLLRVPILIGGEVRGLIGLDNLDRENAFSDSDVRLLQTLAGSLSVALESARLFEETKRNAAELATVNTVSSALASELDVSPLIDLVGEQVRSIFGADIAYVALLDETGKTINFPYQYGEEVEPMPYGEGLTSKIIETGRPLLITAELEREASELGASRVGVDAQSYLGVPILVGGRAVGVVSVESTSEEDAFDENDQRLLTTIAANVGSALHNARLYREAQESRAAAEQANKAKSTFLANMSHELRTPLNAIIGFTRIVRRKSDGVLPDKQIENLDKVLSSSEHLLGLINTVLDIAKIEAGRLDVIPANFNMGNLAEQCVTLAGPLLKPGVSLEKSVEEGLGLVYSDQDKIKQIVINLLSNAAKFTHTGRIVLSVRQDGNETLNIAVTDTGIGISAEALERVFEEFQQADTSTTRQYGGTGLGLAISRSLARLLGGDLTATSELGVGSTFTLIVPMKYGSKLAQSGGSEGAAERKGTVATQPNGSRRTVLVIDDDPDAVYLLQESINPKEFSVVGTRSGHEGLQFAREEQPDAILLDILMPEVDGWQVLNDLKEDAATRNIPVILLTIVDKKALGFRLGASAYLLKPLDPVVVLDALRRVIGEKEHPHKHVLVVDDDPNVAEMLRQILSEHDYELEAAGDGEEGLRAVAARRPDVILLDLMMPKLDGFGVIERLRADPEMRTIPIIVISAKELTDDESRTLRESVAFVMKKQGFDGEMLMQELNTVLEP